MSIPVSDRRLNVSAAGAQNGRMMGIIRNIIGAAAGALLIAFGGLSGVSAEPIVGKARIIDGDTISVAGKRIRLHGIDAPKTISPA